VILYKLAEGARYSFTYPLVTLALSWQLATRDIRLAEDRTGVNPRANVDEVTSPSVPTPCTRTEDLSMNEEAFVYESNIIYLGNCIK